MSNTPRTDAAEGKPNPSEWLLTNYVTADFARQLERELNEVKDRLGYTETKLNSVWLPKDQEQADAVKAERDQWRAMAQANQTLATAIARYAEHREACNLPGNTDMNAACTCGLSELLKQLNK